MAFIADDIAAPSVLWMRRMLDALAEDVCLLGVERDPGPAWRERHPIVTLRDDPPPIVRRAVARLRLADRGSGRKAIDKLRTAMRENAVSVVLIHYARLAVKFAELWERIEIPVFVHCHGFDVTWEMYAQERRGARAHPRDYMQRVAGLPRNVTFIANSHETANRLTGAGIDPGRVVIKYLGVEVSEAPQSRAASSEMTILFLGRLVDCKGPDLVIRAFERACERGLKGRLVLAGDGPMWLTCELLRRRSTVGDRIEMLGAVTAEQGEKLRREADIFTTHHCTGPVSNQVEALGVSVLEAMASALPVVVGRSGGVPELVRDGREGVLLPPEDVEAHANALLQLANDAELRRRMGQAGWERVRDSFRVDQEMVKLREILGLAPAATSPIVEAA